MSMKKGVNQSLEIPKRREPTYPRSIAQTTDSKTKTERRQTRTTCEYENDSTMERKADKVR